MNRATSSTGWAQNPDGILGYTWNPITGCRKGCPYCYARKLATTRLRTLYLSNPNIAIPANMRGKDLHSEDVWEYQKLPFYPRFWEDRLEEPMVKAVTRGGTTVINVGKQKGIFVCDMSDLFGIGIPEEWTRKVMQTIEDSPHRFYLLTKQPQNLMKFSPFPDNCWVGVSATDSIQYATAAYWLKAIEASVKFVSFEPLLEGIHPKAWPWQLFPEGKPEGICDWVIIGAQSNPTVYPEIEWVREIVEAADRSGIPVFLKDNLWPLIKDVTQELGENYRLIQYNEEVGYHKLRQEMP